MVDWEKSDHAQTNFSAEFTRRRKGVSKSNHLFFTRELEEL
jgi:hypothetical protein